jgi:hypothetical protein
LSQELAQRDRGFVVAAFLQQVESRLVFRLRAAGGGRRRGGRGERRLGCTQARVEVDVLFLLLLANALEVMLGASATRP